MSIFQCLTKDDRYVPPVLTVVHEAESEVAAISWLEKNGGGIYKNLLHNFSMKVDAINGKDYVFGRFSPIFAEDTPKNDEKYLSIMKQVENGELTWIQAKGEFLDFIP